MSKELKNIVTTGFSNKQIQEDYENQTRAGLWKSEEKLFKKYFKEKSKIIDIGCGSGRTTFPLAKKGYKVIGVDLTPAMIKTAKKLAKEFKMKMDFRVGDATNLKFKNNSFDNALFSFNGWNQIPGEKNRLRSLKEIHRVIRPEGYFIFTSHVRSWKGYFGLWIKQWIKLFILKPLGFNIKENEFGDRFYKRGGTAYYDKEQYTHIPALSKIKKQIKKAGFELLFYNKRNNIAKADAKLISFNCTMFVCRKLI